MDEACASSCPSDPMTSRTVGGLVAALLLVVLGGCDSQPPEPSNPFDPAFAGERVATAPSDLRLEASTATAITLAWTDNSSFESGVRLERAFATGLGIEPVYAPVATLPPDATTYTDTTRSTEARSYRVVALAPGGTDSLPSDSLFLRFPLHRVQVDPLADFDSWTFAADGARMYGYATSGIVTLDAETGERLGEYPNAGGFAGVLADGRVVVYLREQYGDVVLEVYRGFVREQTIRLGTHVCFVDEHVPVWLSGDGTRAAAACAFDGSFGVWNVPAPHLPPTVIQISPSGGSIVVAGLSRDGRFAIAGSNGETVAVDLQAQTVLWRAPGTGPQAATLSPDDRRVFVYGPGGSVSVLDAATGMVLASAPGSPYDGHFAVDGTRVSYGSGGAVQVARTDDLAPIFRVVGASARASALLPNGLRFVNRTEIVTADFSSRWEVVPPTQ